jgi:CRISPR-associated protein Cmr2
MSAVDAWKDVLDELRSRAGSEPGKSRICLLSFTIAGIQDFLAAARTTRDVWNGSYLLSWLAFKGAIAIAKAIGTPARWDACIFPDALSQAFVKPGAAPDELAIANFPNSVLFAAPATLEQARRIGDDAQRDTSTAWNEITNRVWEVMQQSAAGRSEYARTQWEYQTRFHRIFELYWSAIELPQDESRLQRILETCNIDPARRSC